MSLKRFVSLFTVICFVSVFMLSISAPVNAAPQNESILKMSTASVGSIMYVFGAAMSEVVEKHGGPKIEILPQNALQGLAMLPSKEVDLVMIANDDLSWAYNGGDIYEKMTKGKGFDVRLLMLGTRIPAGQVVGEDSGIKNYQDLKGKTVVLGFGSSVAMNNGAKAALYAGGLTEDDVKVVKTSDVVAAARMVIDKKADACYGSVGTPIFQQVAAARKGARHLGVNDTPETWAKLKKLSSAYFPMKIKKLPKSPPTIKEDIVLVGRNFSVVSRKDLSDESAYTFTKLLWENDKELGPKHPRLKDWVKAHFANIKASAPYHPGAIKFYKEVGAWTPELEKMNNNLLSMK